MIPLHKAAFAALLPLALIAAGCMAQPDDEGAADESQARSDEAADPPNASGSEALGEASEAFHGSYGGYGSYGGGFGHGFRHGWGGYSGGCSGFGCGGGFAPSFGGACRAQGYPDFW